MNTILLLSAAAALHSITVLTIDPTHRLVEGVASDGTTIWASSILDRQILACRKTCRSFATLADPVYPFAIAWDVTRKRLWIAADCPSGVAAIKPCERGALIGLDGRGRIMIRVAPPSGSFHPGDVSAAPGGVFVSDSKNGAVYRLRKDGHSLSPVIAPGMGKSGQGTALDSAGKRLFVADYAQGVGVVDLATGKRTIVPRDDGKPVRGVDGVARCRSTYYGIYNGSSPGTLLAIKQRDGRLKIDLALQTELPDPTQVVFDGKRLLIVADSGWATIDQPDFVRRTGAAIVAVPLRTNCTPE